MRQTSFSIITLDVFSEIVYTFFKDQSYQQAENT